MIHEHFRRPPAFPAGLDAKGTPKAVRDALGEYVALRDRHGEQDRAAVIAESQLEQAAARETKAAADALRAGKSMPASKLDEQKQALAEAKRELDALELAVLDAFAVLEAAIDEHRDRWVAAIKEQARKDRVELVEAVERLPVAEGKLTATLTRALWLENFPASHIGKPLIGVSPLRKPNGDPGAFSEMVEALVTYAAGIKPMPANRHALGVDQREYDAAQQARREFDAARAA